MTASSLFASDNGPHHCYYCGAACSGEHLAKDHVADTFTNRDVVHFPGSPYVCAGCLESLGSGPDTMEMIDGSTRIRTNARGMQPRMYSWIMERDRKRAATKAHVALLRAAVLNPPAPPFAIVLADSGQKQLIFRAPVALDRGVYPLLLEDERIEVDVSALRYRLALAGPLCAALGKPALLGDLNYSSFFRVESYFGDTDVLDRWIEVRDQPLSRLAAWLSPPREDARNEYPGIERGGVSSEARGLRGSGQNVTGDGAGLPEGRGGQVLLDLGESVR